MRFSLKVAQKFYDLDDPIVDRLKQLGFSFEIDDIWRENFCDSEGSIEIASLEELMDFCKEWGGLIIEDGTLTIYNGYVE